MKNKLRSIIAIVLAGLMLVPGTFGLISFNSEASSSPLLGYSLVYADGETYGHDKTVTFEPARAIKYIAVVLTASSGGGDRMREIELYGESGAKLSAASTVSSVSAIRYKDGAYRAESITCTSDPKTKLFDGDVQNHFDIERNWDPAKDPEWLEQTAFLVELNSSTALSKLMVYTGIYNNNTYRHSVKIYASDTLEDLFKEPEPEPDTEFPYAPGTYEDLTETQASAIANTNLLKGRTPQIIDWNTGNSLGGQYSVEDFTNNVYNHRDIDSPDGANPTVIYDMLYPTDMSAILFSGNGGSGMADYATSYKIYVGNDLTTLVSDENLVVSRDQTALEVADLAQTQLYVFGEGAEKRGRYIAFYITQPSRNMSAPYSATARVAEFGVWGNIDMSGVAVDNTASAADISGAHSGNLLVGLTPETVNGMVTGSTELLADGDLTASVTASAGTRLVYELKTGATVNSLRIAANGLKEFEFYVSADRATLFYSVNRVAHYEPASGDSVLTVDFGDNPLNNAKFIGYRIIGSEAEVSELAAYGSYQDYTIDLTVNQDTLDLWKDKNLLVGKIPTIKTPTGSTLTAMKGGENGLPHLTDGIFSEHVDIDGALNGAYITYSFETKYIFDYMAICNFNNATFMVKEYQIYVSNNLGNLYSPDNLVVDYDNTVNLVSAQGFTFSELGSNGKPVGKYVGIYYPVPNINNGDPIVRICELLVSGEVYNGVPDNLAENTNITAYRTENGKPTAISDSEFTSQQRVNILKDTNKTAVSLSSKGKTLDLVIDLCQKAQLDKFVLATETAGNIKAYDVYVSDYLKDLWKSESKAASFTDAGSNSVLAVDKVASGRYVRFSIPAASLNGSNAKILYLSAIGMDSQKLDVVNQLYGIGEGDMSLLYVNNETGEWEAGFDFNRLWATTDSLKVHAADVYGAEYGKESLNVIYKLPNPKMLNRVVIHGIDLPDYRIKKAKVFLGDSLNEVIDKSATALDAYTYPGSGSSAEITFNFASVNASYLRICIEETGSENISPTMLAVFTEIEAYGVDVSNIIPADDDGVYAFKFENGNGIKFNGIKLYETDILPDLTSFAVSKKALTAAQKQDLRGIALMPIGDSYVFEVRDFLGNKVSSFGGRSVEVVVPVPEDVSFAMLAGIKDGVITMLDAGYDDDNNLLYNESDINPTMQYVLVTYSDDTETPEDSTDDDTYFDDTDDFEDNDFSADDTASDETADDTEDDGESDEETGKKPPKVVRKKRKKASSAGSSTADYTIWIIVAAVVVVVAALTTVVIVVKKKKAQKK